MNILMGGLPPCLSRHSDDANANLKNAQPIRIYLILTQQTNSKQNIIEPIMNARQLFFGLLTATVVLTPFATLKPASATKQSNNQLMAQALKPGAKPDRRNSTSSAPRLNPQNISKDNLNHRTKATINNVVNTHKKDQKPSIDPKRQMQYKQDGKMFKNRDHSLSQQGKYTEHTVPPHSGSNRGAERIVKDKNTGDKNYTKDHYRTFKKVTDPNTRNSM